MKTTREVRAERTLTVAQLIAFLARCPSYAPVVVRCERANGNPTGRHRPAVRVSIKRASLSDPAGEPSRIVEIRAGAADRLYRLPPTVADLIARAESGEHDEAPEIRLQLPERSKRSQR